MTISEVFRTEKPVIGMIHLAGKKPDAVLERAKQEILRMYDAGVDAVLVENYYGTPEDAERVLAWLREACSDRIYGVNILGRFARSHALAKKYGAAFIQEDSVSGNLPPEKDAVYAKQIRQIRDGSVFVLGGVRFMDIPVRSGRSLEEDLRLGMERCDAIVAAGKGATEVSLLREFRKTIGDFPLIVGAGVTLETCGEQLSVADGAIVGSYIKVDGQTGNPVDPKRVSALMKAVEGIRHPESSLERGEEAEQRGDYETACQFYIQAADAGNTQAMVRIALLYLTKPFRQVTASNLGALLLSGMPIFPWNFSEKQVPDMKTALEWAVKAADAGDAGGALLAGMILTDTKEKKRGLAYLRKSAEGGNQDAADLLCLHVPSGRKMDDVDYDAALRRFVLAADGRQKERFRLYADLMSGTPAQLSRLGYVLTSAHFRGDSGYGDFRCAVRENGIPYMPVVMRRGAWKSLLRFEFSAFDEEKPLIAVSSDIFSPTYCEYMFTAFHRVRVVGQIRYRSPAFGWHKEEKNGLLLQLDPGAIGDGETAEKLMDSFGLTAEDLAGNTASLVENGEKEYSFEVARVRGSRVEVLLRYTIGGRDDVEEYFEPELRSLTLDLTEKEQEDRPETHS